MVDDDNSDGFTRERFSTNKLEMQDRREGRTGGASTTSQLRGPNGGWYAVLSITASQLAAASTVPSYAASTGATTVTGSPIYHNNKDCLV